MNQLDYEFFENLIKTAKEKNELYCASELERYLAHYQFYKPIR